MSVDKTKQGNEGQRCRDIRRWVETSVWTEKMLTALEKGLNDNSYFAERGLFSLEKAHGAACRSR